MLKRNKKHYFTLISLKLFSCTSLNLLFNLEKFRLHFRQTGGVSASVCWPEGKLGEIQIQFTKDQKRTPIPPSNL